MTASKSAVTAPNPGSPDGDVVERILAEYEPIMARARRAMSSVWHDRRVSKTSLFVLMQLEHHGPLSMSRLAALLDAGLPNVTGIVTRMAERGLVERVRDERDRRVVLVRATPLGRETVAELETFRRQHLRGLIEALDPADQETCLRAFAALRRAAERLDQTSPTPPAP